jgi:hypothetical protein
LCGCPIVSSDHRRQWWQHSAKRRAKCSADVHAGLVRVLACGGVSEPKLLSGARSGRPSGAVDGGACEGGVPRLCGCWVINLLQHHIHSWVTASHSTQDAHKARTHGLLAEAQRAAWSVAVFALRVCHLFVQATGCKSAATGVQCIRLDNFVLGATAVGRSGFDQRGSWQYAKGTAPQMLRLV